MNNSLFSNETYIVIIKEDKYVLINKNTGVEEFSTKLLPEVLHYAIELQSDLEKIRNRIRNEELETSKNDSLN